MTDDDKAMALVPNEMEFNMPISNIPNDPLYVPKYTSKELDDLLSMYITNNSVQLYSVQLIKMLYMETHKYVYNTDTKKFYYLSLENDNLVLVSQDEWKTLETTNEVEK